MQEWKKIKKKPPAEHKPATQAAHSPSAVGLPHSGAWECILSNADFNNILSMMPESAPCLQAPAAFKVCRWITMLAKASKAVHFTAVVQGNQPSWWTTQQLSVPTWRTQTPIFAALHE